MALRPAHLQDAREINCRCNCTKSDKTPADCVRSAGVGWRTGLIPWGQRIGLETGD